MVKRNGNKWNWIHKNYDIQVSVWPSSGKWITRVEDNETGKHDQETEYPKFSKARDGAYDTMKELNGRL